MSSEKNNGSFLYRQMEKYQKQLIGKVAPSRQDEPQKIRMTETRIYIGLNDAQTKEQIHDTEMYMSVLKYVCRNYHVAFSVDIEHGGYFHDDGMYTEETSFTLVLINADRKVVSEIARDLCTFFHQESVLVTENHIDGCFISGNL